MSIKCNCNFCRLQDLRREAKREGKKLSVFSDVCWGAYVYIHPKNVIIDKSMIATSVVEKYLVMWQPALSNHCVGGVQ